jgi:WD40 repeat protein
MTSIDQSMKRIVLTNRRTGRIRILRLDAEDNLTVIQERPGVWDCAISPDGKWLLTTILTVLAGTDQSPQAWDLTTGRAIKNFSADAAALTVPFNISLMPSETHTRNRSRRVRRLTI